MSKIRSNPTLFIKSFLIGLLIWLPIAIMSLMFFEGGDGVVVSLVGFCFSVVFGYEITEKITKDQPSK